MAKEMPVLWEREAASKTGLRSGFSSTAGSCRRPRKPLPLCRRPLVKSYQPQVPGLLEVLGGVKLIFSAKALNIQVSSDTHIPISFLLPSWLLLLPVPQTPAADLFLPHPKPVLYSKAETSQMHPLLLYSICSPLSLWFFPFQPSLLTSPPATSVIFCSFPQISRPGIISSIHGCAAHTSAPLVSHLVHLSIGSIANHFHQLKDASRVLGKGMGRR
jgi:hypothetical protein